MVVDSTMDRRKRKSDRPDIRPSDKVKKRLFDKPDEHEKDEELKRVEQDNLLSREKMKVKYGYDPVEDKILRKENTPYIVVKVIEASYEKDLNGKTSSASVENVKEHTTDQSSTITPDKKCVDVRSDSKPSSSNVVNGNLNERTQNEGNCICETHI
jgi:hypothetical protein